MVSFLSTLRQKECQEPLESSLRATRYDHSQRLAVDLVEPSTSLIAYCIYRRTIPKVKWNEALVSYLKTTLKIIFIE